MMRNRMTKTAATLAALTLVAAAPDVRAEDGDDTGELRAVQIDAALGIRGGDGSVVGDVRVYLGGATSLARTSRLAQFFAGAGLHASYGSVTVDDERGLGGRSSRERITFGPELRLGWAWGPGWPDAYLYAAVAPLVANPGREGPAEVGDDGWAFGGRGAIGFAWPGSFATLAEGDSSHGNQPHADALMMLLLLAPNTLEITAEHSRAADGPRWRYGVGFGYAF